MRLLAIPLTLFLVATSQTAAEAEDSARGLDFRDPAWEIQGEQSRVETLEGRTVLRMGTGRATRRDVVFQDGTIEFEMRNAPRRSFAYVLFRMASDGEHEAIYFRPHKSRLPDAIQYMPVYRGSGQWQLYHGPGHTAAAHLPIEEWVKVRIVLRGRQAAVFVGDMEAPKLVVPELAHEARAGYLALRAFVARGEPAETAAGTFANLVVRPGEVPYDFAGVQPSAAEPAAIREWQVSSAFVPEAGAIQALPATAMSGPWKALETLPSGLLELARHVDQPRDARRVAVLARLALPAAESQIRRLDLGFSDEASVFLNGRLLFSADQSYSFNFPRRQGLIGFDQAHLYLPLEKGENELVIAVTDRFGGWGLMGRWGRRPTSP